MRHLIIGALSLLIPLGYRNVNPIAPQTFIVEHQQLGGWYDWDSPTRSEILYFWTADPPAILPYRLSPPVLMRPILIKPISVDQLLDNLK